MVQRTCDAPPRTRSSLAVQSSGLQGLRWPDGERQCRRHASGSRGLVRQEVVELAVKEAGGRRVVRVPVAPEQV